MEYLERHWSEATGEIWTNYWGTSTFYFEVADDGTVLRQVQEFEHKQYLKYDFHYPDDKYGGLADFPIDPNNEEYKKISKFSFEEKWKKDHYQLYPEIVMTNSVVGGSPRIDGTRLTVGDVVRIVTKDGLADAIADFELSMLEVRQALSYCSKLRCQEDQQTKFCHNCTLRAKQDHDEIEDEEDYWLGASILLQKYFDTLIQ